MSSVPVLLECPVRGEWITFDAPGHHPLAHDYIAVDTHGNPYAGRRLLPHLLWRLPVEHTYTWGCSVLAPIAGTVVAAVDGVPDREHLNLPVDLIRALVVQRRRWGTGEFRGFGGNHIILQSGRVFVLLAHLRCGSVQVEVGEQIATGAVVAEVGNSGASVQPHLHLQVMSEMDPFTSALLPYAFCRFERAERGGWSRAEATLPGARERFRVEAHEPCA